MLNERFYNNNKSPYLIAKQQHITRRKDRVQRIHYSNVRVIVHNVLE